jgi:serine/threonine-protein kinase
VTQPASTAVELIADRYQKVGELGVGGMAAVYEVTDSATGRRLALKRPRIDGNPEHRKRIEELFAREFHTLVQLSHPRIVQVYDYGVDAQGPYYTMELLDGGDLLGLMPVDFRRVCSIASDVCSALSLLHSRRIVHRDLSPRNIRCTSDGLAKLIDFGAMTPMGASKELVGTPVYCAPEILNKRALDARTDLYALGATLYYALTERHPYPVRDFASLPNAWRFGVARPSELVPGIPSALDALVLDLLQLEPGDRPSNAAEVMARLSAIAGTQQGEHLLVAQSYLATPTFIGRTSELIRVKGKMMRALRKRGAAVLVEGPAGSGRSRFLDASLLSSKLLGMTVMRADADDGEEDYGVVRRLFAQLQDVMPDVITEVTAPVLGVLAHILPELAAGRDVEPVAVADVASLRPQLQSALRQVFLDVAARRPLLFAIDDLHAIDEPSLAAIGLLAQSVRRAPLVILATAVTGAPTVAAFKLFASIASNVSLHNLNEDEAQSLLSSVFGASHTLELLTRRLYALTGGSPRDLMRLAQHLVDSGSARYEAGTWLLQAGAEASELPQSVAQMLFARLRLLSKEAFDLARAIALCPEKSFSLEECQRLSVRERADEVLADIEALGKADVLRPVADRFALADRAWVPLLHADLSPDRARELHVRLAEVFEARPDEEFRHAQHLLRAGEIDRALDRFVAHTLASRALTDRSPEAFHQLLRSLPADWLETYEQMLQLLRERGRPKRDELAVLIRLSTMGTILGVGRRHMTELTDLLKQASGLLDWEQADPALDPGTRLRQALEGAQARYEASSEHERVTDPSTAIRELATAARLPMSLSALTMDLSVALATPSLAPFFPLVPAFTVIEQLVVGVRARLSGRLERAHEVYGALLTQLATVGIGFVPTHLEYARLPVMTSRAVIDAAWGRAACLEVADQIEKHQVWQSSAWVIRMVYQLWQGDAHEAELSHKQFELARVKNSASQTFEGIHLPWQLGAHVAMEDLTRIKRSLAEVAPFAARFPGFRTVLRYGEAEYQRIRGDAASALEQLTDLLRECEPGTHQMWSQLAAAHVRALDEAGHTTQAEEQGRAHLAAASQAELGTGAEHWIALALCVIEAKLGRADAAGRADAMIEHCLALGTTGLRLGLAYEARTRIAILQSDMAGYERYRALCEWEFVKAANAALSAKLQRLTREAHQRKVIAEVPILEGARNLPATTIKLRLKACGDAAERARVMLTLLAQRSGATIGHLYQIRGDVPTLVASIGGREPDATLADIVHEYIAAEAQADTQATGITEVATQSGATFQHTAFRPVLLSHYLDGRCVITGLAAFVHALDRPFAHPAELASQLSQIAHDAGDATGLVV